MRELAVRVLEFFFSFTRKGLELGETNDDDDELEL